MKNPSLSLSIFFFLVIIFAVSCKQEDAEPNSTLSLLDKKFYKQWFSDTIDTESNSSTGELKYTISSSEINSTTYGAYKYNKESSLLLANGVYQIVGSSTKGDQYFYIKEGKSSNEIMVSLKSPNTYFNRYCLDSYLCMVGLRQSHMFLIPGIN